jgi:hypothetical protein
MEAEGSSEMCKHNPLIRWTMQNNDKRPMATFILILQLLALYFLMQTYRKIS